MRNIFWTAILFGMWMILTNNIEIANILLGLTLSFSISLLYIKTFTQDKFIMINPYYAFIYLLILIKNIILSNIHISKRVLSKDMKINPAIVEVKTELKSDWKKLLLANSVTLTPETITLDVKDDMLYIHIIECADTNNTSSITKEFEDIIAKI